MNSSPFNPIIGNDYRNALLFSACLLAIEETNQSSDILTNFTLEAHEIACVSVEDN